MLAYEEVFLLNWVGFLATILLTILLRSKLKLIVISPLPSIFGMLGFYTFAFIYADKFPPSPSFWLLLLSLSAGIGIYLTITTIVIVYAVINRHHQVKSNKFVFAAVCCMVLYIYSYMLLSRHGMQISEKAGFEDCYYITAPEPTDTWGLLHYTYSVFYYVPICMEDALGTACFAWYAPTMQM